MPMDDIAMLHEINETSHRLEEKFNKAMSEFMRKEEHEILYKQITLDLSTLEVEVKQEKLWAMQEHDKLRQEFNNNLNKIIDGLETFKRQVTRSQLRARDFIIATLFSFLTGGGVVGLIELLLHK